MKKYSKYIYYTLSLSYFGFALHTAITKTALTITAQTFSLLSISWFLLHLGLVVVEENKGEKNK